jgi:hypothetical protein
VEEAYGKARELLLRILKRDLYKIVAKKNLSAELKVCIIPFISHMKFRITELNVDSSNSIAH